MSMNWKSGSWNADGWRKFDVSGRYFIVPNGLMEQEISSSAKLTLLGLLYFWNSKTGACFPGLAKIGAVTGQSNRTLNRTIRELEEAGVIQIERRFNRCESTGKIEKTSNKYIIPERANLALPTAKTARKTGEGDANLAHKHYYPFNNTSKPPLGGDDFIDSVLTEIEEEADGQ